ncbi:MAG: FAD-binding oxidoreductase [Acidobacteriota bacterium]|nr:FAD-binding oxidoreductase [Acidobacteriota bacterium]
MDQLLEKLRRAVGSENVLSEPDELLVYECDGLTQHKHVPRAVVFPASTEQVAAVVRTLVEACVPFAPRGAGTGLSGGALALNRGVIIELARMRRLLKVDTENRLAVVEVGMVNAQLSRAVAEFGLHYVPDPSSGAACTIGGNIAENAGGIHCLKYGTTTDHILGARVVLPDGEIVELGGAGAPETAGYDLLGVFVGSEGTLGIATEATVRLIPLPPAVRTLLADFADVDAASRAVSAIIAAGLVPAALEMVDGATIRAVEASVFAAGLPLDAEAALLIELDGIEIGLDQEAARAESICLKYGARHVRHAADEVERKKLWAARKGAFGAMGRISPDLMVQDAVVPRSRLPEVLGEINRIGAKYRLRVANVFHAGDGNLHPLISFDARDADEVQRVKEAGREIMNVCVNAGGTITGEHGVGIDKSAYMPLIFSEDDLDAMLAVRAAFDPTGLCNPGKIIPAPRGCGEARAVVAAKTGDQSSNGAMQTPTREADETGVRAPSFAIAAGSSSAHAPLRTVNQIDTHTLYRALAEIVDTAHINTNGELLIVAPAATAEAAEIVRLAAREGLTVAPAGADGWLNADSQRNTHVDLMISTRRLTRLVAHEPADLVATIEAGHALSTFNEAARRRGQWLPLDPPDDGSATLGGVAATGLGGAQSFGYGTPRQFVLGMKVVLGDGRIIKAGGGVVKNVAGYDLCKLFVGSYGTLGLITELTVKLRPFPESQATLIVSGETTDTVLRAARSLLSKQFSPVALELLSQPLAESLDIDSRSTGPILLIRFAGSEAMVTAQLESAREWFSGEKLVVTTCAEDERLWQALAALPYQPEHRLIWRAGVRPSEMPALLHTLEQHFANERQDLMWQASLGAGRLRVFHGEAITEAASTRLALEMIRSAARATGGSFVFEKTPEPIQRKLDPTGNADLLSKLASRVKQQLDPAGTFSRRVEIAPEAR